MPDEGNCRTSIHHARLEYAIQANCPYLKKGYIPPRKNTKGKWVKGLRGLTYEE